MPETIQKKSAFILKIYDDIEEIDSITEFINILKEICSLFGYEFFCATYLPLPTENNLQAKILVSNWPARLIQKYDEYGLLRNSPIIKAIWKSSGAIHWNLDDIVQKRGPLEGPKTRHIFEEYNMTMGTVIPGHSLSGQKGAVMFSGSREQPKGGELAALHLLSHFLFAHIATLSTSKRKKAGRLSKRELECVELVAQGKTTDEIAIILGLSASTVAGYLTAAATKLEATNRSHLVALAIKQGLLKI